jgi:uncharacterized membrane protein
MDWIFLSIASAAIFAVVSVLDKFILMRHAPSASTFIVLLGLLQLPAATLMAIVSPPELPATSAWAIAYASGLLWGVSLVLMFQVMSKHEVSRVLPVIATSPVYVAIMAMVFLDEGLTLAHWIAIAVTVTGAFLISTRPVRGSVAIVLGWSLGILVAASVLVAAAQLLGKIALNEITLTTMFPFRSLGLATGCVALSLRRATYAETRSMFSRIKSGGLMLLTEAVIAPFAALVTIWAIMLGPVSLAVTLMSSRPLFVFVLSAILSTKLLPMLGEPLDKVTLAIKGVSIALIISGVVTISIL